MKFNSKAYIHDRGSRKNRPIIHDLETFSQIEKEKDEILHCKAPLVIRYLSYCLDQNVFFEMIKLYIKKYRDSSAGYREFMNCLPQNLTGDAKFNLEKLLRDINQFYLKSKCAPVFKYQIESENDILKNIKFERTEIENVAINLGSVQCDVKLFHNTDEPNTYKQEILSKVLISSPEEAKKKLANLAKPNLVLLNYNDFAYVIQIFTNDEIEWIKNNIAVI
jgi:aminopeptidase N